MRIFEDFANLRLSAPGLGVKHGPSTASRTVRLHVKCIASRSRTSASVRAHGHRGLPHHCAQGSGLLHCARTAGWDCTMVSIFTLISSSFFLSPLSESDRHVGTSKHPPTTDPPTPPRRPSHRALSFSSHSTRRIAARQSRIRTPLFRQGLLHTQR